jgi:hypothetical protein
MILVRSEGIVGLKDHEENESPDRYRTNTVMAHTHSFLEPTRILRYHLFHYPDSLYLDVMCNHYCNHCICYCSSPKFQHDPLYFPLRLEMFREG